MALTSDISEKNGEYTFPQASPGSVPLCARFCNVNPHQVHILGHTFYNSSQFRG